MGFRVGPDLVCTAPHVVTAATGERGLPGSPVVVAFAAFAGAPAVPAGVELWRPDIDVAGLRLAAPPPRMSAAVRLVDVVDLWGHQCRTFGFPAGHDDGVWAVGTLRGPQASGWVQLDDDRGAGFATAAAAPGRSER